MDHAKVSHAVELICNQGCTSVNAIIEVLQNGDSIEQTAQMNPAEVRALIKELKEIMSVYEKNSQGTLD
ncbi:MAG: hypothetical protein OQL06_01645 [Gammaproteobacteria bacterium]|nr:hypothetical protein [Gammaproteobacteria bacterium]